MSDAPSPRSLAEALALIEQQRVRIAGLEAQLQLVSAREHRGFGLARLLRILRLRRRASASPVASAEVEAIRATGLFDVGFYLEQARGRADWDQVQSAPIEHYLAVGGFEGLDPGPGFDSDWYLAINPDVQAAGVNPLVHYVYHGLPEGRLPHRGAKPALVPGRANATSTLNRKLWAGFYHLAAPELQTRAHQWFDAQAAGYLAAWEYVHGQPQDALEWLEVALSHTTTQASRQQLVALAKCYTALNDAQALTALLAENDYLQPLSEVLPFVQANAAAMRFEQEVRLSAINSIFYSAGLVGIKPFDAGRSLALDNLSSEPSPSVQADHLPLISVIIPAYNAGQRLGIALDSLLAQTWHCLEIIVVDDASSDNTAEVAQAYMARDSRVRYLANDCNLGAYPTRNRGMRAALGEFVTVHDSDDWSHPQKLERQVQPLLKDPSKVATCSSWVRVTPDLRFVGPWMLSGDFVETNHSSCLLRRELLAQTGLWDAVNVAADTEFLWRLEQHFGHQSMVHVLLNVPLSFALSDDSTLTRTKATHVKTIHYGLRRLYREAARWWHRQENAKPIILEGQRPFPVPLGIMRGSPSAFDALWVADFSATGDVLSRVLEQLQQVITQGQSVCLLHWPDYLGWHGATIADEVFEFCQRWSLGFAHMGLTLSVPKVVLVDEALWQHPPSHTVQLTSLQCVETPEGSLCAAQQALLEYFANGGVVLGWSDAD